MDKEKAVMGVVSNMEMVRCQRGSTREKREIQVELGRDASSGPYVDLAVEWQAEHNFWTAVEPGLDVLAGGRHLRGRGSEID